MKFHIAHNCLKTKARVGKITTPHGEIDTPTFMPVGTQASVKRVFHKDLRALGTQIMLSNTYHLYLRPGMEVLLAAGGIHKFMNWPYPVLTDSGGYQVYSLSDKRKIHPGGVHFKSHIDGSTHFFSPESAIDIQRTIGADIIMAFDECTPYPCDYRYAEESMHLTHTWLDRCWNRFEGTTHRYGLEQALFPIIQGSVYTDLRMASAKYVSQYPAKGYAIGGLSVGEPEEDMYQMVSLVCDILPWEKPRYLMGVGTPYNLVKNIALGIDMFDCVMPTRNARNGMIFTLEGVINLKNKKWEQDFSPLDQQGESFVDANYTRAYVHHLFKAGELLAGQITSIHNLAFYLSLMKKVREEIARGTFYNWFSSAAPKLKVRL